jgi:DNA-binding NarL/FixJ family response regulator
VAILSLHYSDQLVREVLDSGVRAYILKSDASRDLLSGIDALIDRQVFFTSGAAQILEMHSGSELVRYAVKNCMIEP